MISIFFWLYSSTLSLLTISHSPLLVVTGKEKTKFSGTPYGFPLLVTPIEVQCPCVPINEKKLSTSDPVSNVFQSRVSCRGSTGEVSGCYNFCSSFADFWVEVGVDPLVVKLGGEVFSSEESVSDVGVHRG